MDLVPLSSLQAWGKYNKGFWFSTARLCILYAPGIIYSSSKSI
jgi:hypothetical protein